MTNSKAVKKAPTQTAFHLIFASGNILNITANSEVIKTTEKTTSNIWKRTKNDSAQYFKTHDPRADNKADNTRETSNKKAMDSIKPKEKSRVLRTDQIPDLVVVVFTSQIIFNDFCICTNAPVAPTSIVMIAIIVATVYPQRWLAIIIIP